MDHVALSLLFFTVLPLLQKDVASISFPWSCYAETDSCYYFPNFKTSQTEASCWCRSIGGHLLKIDSNVDLDFIGQIIDQEGGAYWIGATDYRNEKQFLWDDGTDANGMIPWYEHEPNNVGSEECVVVTKSVWLQPIPAVLPNISAFDYPCFHHQDFICEKGTASSRLWNVVSRDQIYPAARLGQFSGVSSLKCADLCARTCGCLSLAHRQHDGDCILYDNHISRLTNPQSSLGYHHYA